jgi:hypothetical protein
MIGVVGGIVIALIGVYVWLHVEPALRVEMRFFDRKRRYPGYWRL